MPTANLVVGNDGGNSLQGTGGADLIYGFGFDVVDGARSQQRGAIG
jgi:hypothetical protein